MELLHTFFFKKFQKFQNREIEPDSNPKNQNWNFLRIFQDFCKFHQIPSFHEFSARISGLLPSRDPPQKRSRQSADLRDLNLRTAVLEVEIFADPADECVLQCSMTYFRIGNVSLQKEYFNLSVN